MIDSTHIKAHRSAGGGKGGPTSRRSASRAGGRTSKLHALSDGLGRPLALLLTVGNINDIGVARALLQRVGPVGRLIADCGYDANHLRRFLADQQAEAVIPSTTSRRKPIPYDTVAYRDRNRIERMWCRLKDRNYLSGAYLAAIFSCWAN